MTELEKKVRESLEVSAEILADQEAAKVLKKEFDAAFEALPGISDLVSTYEQKAKALDAKSIADNAKGSKLKEEILGLMTEKTHKFDFATVTKQVRRSLKVLNGLELLQRLPEKMAEKVKLSFPGSDIIKAAELGAIYLGMDTPSGDDRIAEIIVTESLRVTVTKEGA